MQQKCIPKKNSQNRKLLWEVLVEGNSPSYSDLKMPSRGPGQPPHENLKVLFVFSHKRTVTQKISSKGKGHHLLGRQWERALAAVDGVSRPHVDQSF
ncbi:hypothetical protein E2C01_073749 [Portunus trituberculatus]|uniref:Uncharacterized protein n=1 Tax=Portunus trituberculatus TaxID=210409 RepID=A0A5B7IAA3_PORTR|nr:hypothetical protein [Portunus trituberculatus]